MRYNYNEFIHFFVNSCSNKLLLSFQKRIMHRNLINALNIQSNVILKELASKRQTHVLKTSNLLNDLNTIFFNIKSLEISRKYSMDMKINGNNENKSNEDRSMIMLNDFNIKYFTEEEKPYLECILKFYKQNETFSFTLEQRKEILKQLIELNFYPQNGSPSLNSSTITFKIENDLELRSFLKKIKRVIRNIKIDNKHRYHIKHYVDTIFESNNSIRDLANNSEKYSQSLKKRNQINVLHHFKKLRRDMNLSDSQIYSLLVNEELKRLRLSVPIETRKSIYEKIFQFLNILNINQIKKNELTKLKNQLAEEFKLSTKILNVIVRNATRKWERNKLNSIINDSIEKSILLKKDIDSTLKDLQQSYNLSSYQLFYIKNRINRKDLSIIQKDLDINYNISQLKLFLKEKYNFTIKQSREIILQYIEKQFENIDEKHKKNISLLLISSNYNIKSIKTELASILNDIGNSFIMQDLDSRTSILCHLAMFLANNQVDKKKLQMNIIKYCIDELYPNYIDWNNQNISSICNRISSILFIQKRNIYLSILYLQKQDSRKKLTEEDRSFIINYIHANYESRSIISIVDQISIEIPSIPRNIIYSLVKDTVELLNQSKLNNDETFPIVNKIEELLSKDLSKKDICDIINQENPNISRRVIYRIATNLINKEARKAMLQEHRDYINKFVIQNIKLRKSIQSICNELQTNLTEFPRKVIYDEVRKVANKVQSRDQ